MRPARGRGNSGGGPALPPPRPLPLLLLLLFLPSLRADVAAPAPGEPCWEALLRCQGEPACGSAYGQSQAACQPVLGGAGGCPSHCVAALLQLNGTRRGPALERCECGPDVRCRRLKAALEPCLPRPARGGLGCTAARRRCQAEPACRDTLASYLARCGQLFNGRRCTAACRAAIGALLATAGGPLLERCVCDGAERPFCQVLKDNMGRLCFGPAAAAAAAEAEDDDYEDEEEASPRPPPPPPHGPRGTLWGRSRAEALRPGLGQEGGLPGGALALGLLGLALWLLCGL
ncbi:growth arrest-specific protein 1-like [Dromiciops gliroides]|uniref:growth arrest-specific protein 1-like n=1 Tax=Dromiciops gliroides TaxID=33562 RepID=UPI001CC447C5|nr:growth arrest-specific protein 1-like [Dromiciops gliroides]